MFLVYGYTRIEMYDTSISIYSISKEFEFIENEKNCRLVLIVKLMTNS